MASFCSELAKITPKITSGALAVAVEGWVLISCRMQKSRGDVPGITLLCSSRPRSLHLTVLLLDGDPCHQSLDWSSLLRADGDNNEAKADSSVPEEGAMPPTACRQQFYSRSGSAAGMDLKLSSWSWSYCFAWHFRTTDGLDVHEIWGFNRFISREGGGSLRKLY